MVVGCLGGVAGDLGLDELLLDLRQTSTGGDELTDDDVLLQAGQRVDLALDSGLGQDTGGLLEGRSGQEGVGSQAGLGDAKQDLAGLNELQISLCDGEQAADLLEKQQFDLVLLDVMLPGVDGFALMDYIAPTGTPVIFLTAKNAVADRVRGLKLGAYDYIVKPFAPAELLARVEGLLRHTGRRAATLRVFDVEVDPDNRTVTQNGRAVELTPREFTLLLVLVRARGQALYRDILYERVWGPDAEPNPRALDLHIHRLRKKLDWADKIVTVPKVGYKLLAER